MMKRSIISLTVLFATSSNAALIGADLDAANNYFNNNPDIAKYAPWIKEGVFNAPSLEQANNTLSHNSYYNPTLNRVIYVNQINRNTEMKKTVMATVITAAIGVSGAANATNYFPDLNSKGFTDTIIVARAISANEGAVKFNDYKTEVVSKYNEFITSNNVDGIENLDVMIRDKYKDLGRFDYNPNDWRTIPAGFFDPKPVAIIPSQADGEAMEQANRDRNQVVYTDIKTKQDKSSSVKEDLSQPASAPLVAAPIVSSPSVTPPQIGKKAPDYIAPVATPTAIPATPVAPAEPTKLYTVINPAPVAPLAPTKVALKPAVAPAYVTVDTATPPAGVYSTSGALYSADTFKTTTVAAPADNSAAINAGVAQIIVDRAKAAKDLAMSKANTIGGKVTAKDSLEHDATHTFTILPPASPDQQVVAMSALTPSTPAAPVSVAKPYNNDRSMAIANIQGGKATTAANVNGVVVNSPALPAPVGDLTGFVINPQTDNNDSNTTTIQKESDFVAPPMYVAPTPSPVAVTPATPVVATPKAPVANVAPVVAPSAPDPVATPIDLSKNTVIVDHLPGKLNVSVDTLPQVDGFASTSYDVVDTQKVAPVVVPVQDNMNIAHNNPTGAPAPVATPIPVSSPAPLTITTDAKQYAPVSGAAPVVPQAQKFNGVTIQTIQDADQNVTFTKTEDVAQTSVKVVAAQQQANQVVLTPNIVSNTPAPQVTTAPVAQANTVNTTAPVLTVAPATTAQTNTTAPAASTTPAVANTPVNTPVSASTASTPSSNGSTPTAASTPVVASPTASNTPVVSQPTAKPMGATPGVVQVANVPANTPANVGAYQQAVTQAQIDANNKAIADVSARSKANTDRLNGIEEKNNKRFSDIDKRMVEDRKEARSGIAGAMAMASTPQVQTNQKFMVSAGAATFNGESAVAVGASTNFNDHVVGKLNVSADTGSNFGVGVGIGVGF